MMRESIEANETRHQPTSGEMLDHMGTDAVRWAEEFCRLFEVHRRWGKTAFSPVDDQVGLMITWFANALQAGYTSAAHKDIDF